MILKHNLFNKKQQQQLSSYLFHRSWFGCTQWTVSVPVHQLCVHVPCSSHEAKLKVPFAQSKADWVSWHAAPLFLTASEFALDPRCSCRCRSLLDNEVSRFNKWLLFLPALLLHKWSGNQKAQAHPVAPWQHIKYLCACRHTGRLNPC